MTQFDKVLYTGRTHTRGGRGGRGGRDGSARSDDGRLDISLTPPGAARRLNIALPADVAVAAEVDLGTGDGGYFLQARLAVSLPGVGAGTARALIDAAHATCPYSKATHGNIDVAISIA
jgi:osmotically inducible protein OsmC